MLKMMSLANPPTTPKDDQGVTVVAETKPLLARFIAPDLRQAFKAFGPGWQMLTDGGLREAVRRHHLPHAVAEHYTQVPREEVSFERSEA